MAYKLDMDAARNNNTNRTESSMPNKIADRIYRKNAAKINARYNDLRAEAEEQIKRITGGFEGHGAGERLNYGHVGDLAYLVEQLTNAADFINGTDDEN